MAPFDKAEHSSLQARLAANDDARIAPFVLRKAAFNRTWQCLTLGDPVVLEHALR